MNHVDGAVHCTGGVVLGVVGVVRGGANLEEVQEGEIGTWSKTRNWRARDGETV